MEKGNMMNEMIPECPVCLDEIENPITLKECGHSICKECCIHLLK